MGQVEERTNGAAAEKKSRPAPTGANKHDVFFGHGTAKRKNQRFTIAIVPVDSSTANVGVAVCSTKDPFNKRVGRLAAHGRAVKRPTLTYRNVDTTTIEGMLSLKQRVKEEIAGDICAIKNALYKNRV